MIKLMMRICQILSLSVWALRPSSELGDSHHNSRLRSRVVQEQDGPNSGFVYSPGDGNLYLRGKLFNFRNFNTPTIFDGGEYQSLDILKSIVGFGTPVARTYTLKIANDNFEHGRIPASESHITGWDHRSNDWIYNEQQWRKIDRVMDLSRRYGVKLIIPIINQDYGNPDSNYIGTFVDLIRHRYNIYDYKAAGNKIDFFTDKNMINAFKQLITFFLNRINTVNGFRYGDDNTVLAFETGNELNWGGSHHHSGPPGNWTVEIARHLKLLAPKILVMDGSYSRDPVTAWQTEALESTHVELFSYHFYGRGDTEAYDMLNNKIRDYGKTLIIGEHGFYSDPSVFREIYKKMTCAGALVWALLPHSEKGGFLTHSEGHNIFGYHVPGWLKQSSKEFDTHEAEVIASTYEASYTILGLDPPSKPIPGLPEAFIVTNSTHVGLSWRGAAWAQGYEIFGAESQSHPFHLISSDIPDNLEAGQLFVPLNPENPTAIINVLPRKIRPPSPQKGWKDTKWWWKPKTCCDSDSILRKRVDRKDQDSAKNSNATESKITILPSLQPMETSVRGGWYSVRGVSADGVPGRRSKPIFVKADWEEKRSR